jgi:hypothetical protein
MKPALSLHIKHHGTNTKTRHLGQWNKIEDPEINSHNYGHLIPEKGAKNSLFNKWCWKNMWESTCKWLKLDPYLLTYIKIHSKWIKDLNVSPNMLKLLQENVRKTLEDIGIGNNFLKRTLIP